MPFKNYTKQYYRLHLEYCFTVPETGFTLIIFQSSVIMNMISRLLGSDKKPFCFALAEKKLANTKLDQYLPQPPRPCTHTESRSIPRKPSPKAYYAATDIVRWHSEYIKRVLDEGLKKLQLPIAQLRSCLKSWKSDMNHHDAKEKLSKERITFLLQLLNIIFFAGVLPPIDFHWHHDDHSNGETVYDPNTGKVDIFVDPRHFETQKFCTPGDERRMHRMAVFLHEMAHVFDMIYVCGECPDHDYYVGPCGHGDAWMTVTGHVEEAVPYVLGGKTMRMELGRLAGLREYVEETGKMPQRRDLERYWGPNHPFKCNMEEMLEELEDVAEIIDAK